MRPVAPRTRRGERTAEEILEAAREHLAEVGVEDFSLRGVARRAGLAPSALYNHFDSREALVNALAMEAVELLGAYFAAAPATSGSSGQRLRALAIAYLRFADEHPVRYRLVFDMLESPSESWTYFAEVAYPFSVLVATVADGLAAGELVDREGVGAAGVAYGLWSLVHGFVMLSAHHLAHVADDLSPLRLAAVDAHLAGLMPSATSTKGAP